MKNQSKKSKRKATKRSKTKRATRPARGGTAARPRRANVLAAATTEPVLPSPDREFRDSLVPGLGRDATNALERHTALEHVVVNVWATEDVSLIRRAERPGDCKWVMWRRTTLPPI